MAIKKVCVVGLGYIGLPTAAVLASRGIDVVGVDVNQSVVDTINDGHIHIIEPDLDIIVRAVVMTKKLRANSMPESADVFIIAVPTPLLTREENVYDPDLSFIEAAAISIAPHLKKDDLVILESTSPVGTTEKLTNWLSQARPDLTFPQEGGMGADIKLAHCPERVLPGNVLQEIVSNDRVIGGITHDCSEKAIELYKLFVRGECIVTNARTAELAKLTENAFRDVNIAFANELSLISESLGIDVWELIKLANRHPRVNILNPGPGVGGHCIAIDPWFIVSSDPENSKLITLARKVNDSKPMHVVRLVKKSASQFANPVIGCLGLSFKADIDDIRESPALKIVLSLADDNIGILQIVEPNLKVLPSCLEGKVEKKELAEVLKVADILVLLVDHKEFLGVDRELIENKLVIDTRGVL